MARNKKVRADRVIILILGFLLLLMAIIFGVYLIYNLLKTDNDTQTVQPIETTDGVRISLNDYTIYYDDTNDLGFNFIVADINFSSNEAISFDLKNLQTSEKVLLSDVSKYTNKMDTSGYDLKKLEINTTGVVSEENNINVKLFIPYETDSNILNIFNLADSTNSINIDLTKKAIAATTLKLNDSSDEIVVGDTTVYVSKAYISSTMIHAGERYTIPGSLKIYTYEITVSEAKDNVQIVDAIFYLDGDSYENHCMSSDYTAIDCDNILGKDLKTGSEGGLFFEIATDGDEIKDGTLLIKFSNQNEWVEIADN